MACIPHWVKLLPPVPVFMFTLPLIAPLATSLVVSRNWLLGTYNPSRPSVSYKERFTFTSSSPTRRLLMLPLTRWLPKPLMVAYRYAPCGTTMSLISTSSSRRSLTLEPSTALMSSSMIAFISFCSGSFSAKVLK